jgi:DNA-binding XRE family transcriptional regulator
MGQAFEDFYREIKSEARDEGSRAVAELRAKELKYQLITALVSRRRQLRWTQGDLASESGVPQEEISRIERGRKSPNLETYARLAAALDLGVALKQGRHRRGGPARRSETIPPRTARP